MIGVAHVLRFTGDKACGSIGCPSAVLHNDEELKTKIQR